MLNVALELFVRAGPSGLSMSGLAKALGAPSGSVYHRFKSRDRLMAVLWLDAVERFQTTVIGELGKSPSRAGTLTAIQAALDWIRANPGRAQLLLLYRRQDLISGDWPEDIQSQAKLLSEQLEQALRRQAQALDLDIERVVFAVSDILIAGVRRDLNKGRTPAKSRDKLVLEAARAILTPP